MHTERTIKKVTIESINWLTQKVKFIGYDQVFNFDEFDEVLQ